MNRAARDAPQDTAPPPPAALVEVCALGFSVERFPILDSVSLRVAAGEFVGLIGPNGAGKTTLLRVMVGILQPSTGQVLLEGRPMDRIPSRDRARRIAYLGQESPGDFPFPVLDILLMGRYPFLGRLDRESEADIERARRALAYVGLEGFEERYFHELSGGERQLVLFSRILVQDTRLLLLDEPTSNLDIRHQDLFFSMARELAGEKRGVVAAVHNINVASRYCTRLVLLHDGRVAADGPPDEVLRAEILDPVYRSRTIVTRSTSTGSLTVDVVPRRSAGVGPRIHLIGGAGSAVNLTRELSRLGFRLSGGVAHDHDADEQLWKALEIESIVVGAFSRITQAEVDRAASLVEAAELTILCSFPVGPGNLENLRLAARARRLVIVLPADDSPRGFFSEEGRRLFDELGRSAAQMGYRELVAALEAGKLLTPGRLGPGPGGQEAG
jgi:iron complex transport system ATP-binding protein